MFIDPQSVRATSYQVELAIQVPALVALVGAAATLRRPGMGHLAWAWSLFTALSGMSAVGLWLQMRQHPAGIVILLSSFMPLFAGLVMLWDAVDVVAGPGRPVQASLRRALLMGLGTMLLLTLLSGGEAYPLRAITVGRVVYFLAMAGIGWRAWQWAARRPAVQPSLRLLALAGALGAVRIIVRALIDYDQMSPSPSLPEATMIVASVLHQAMFVLAIVMAVLTLERSAMAAQSAALSRAERELAASRRLEGLGKMASAIAHDFNNVLTVILAGVESAATAAPGDDAARRDGLRDASAGADRARGLAERLLDFARARPAMPVVFSPAERVAAGADVWRRLVRLPSTLHVSTEATTPSVRLDPVQFDQIVLNLVANAADAVAGGGSVRVVVDRHRIVAATDGTIGVIQPGEYASVRVEDTGTGMSPDVLRNAFEPFFTTKGDRGTGLGLATVAGIVRDAQGDLVVATAPGTGTRVEVLLPAVC